MHIEKTKLDGVLILTPKIFKDDRGFFSESYSKQTFAENNIHYDFIQDNHSFNEHKNTFRGLHYQKNPKAQTMLVRTVRGEVIDFVVDIRKESPTFGQHISQVLSYKNHKQILIPKGFAHGFLTLTDNVTFLYKTDELYAPKYDKILNFKNIGLEIDMNTNEKLTIADKDMNAPDLDNIDNNFVYTK
jgi:dTDP-4-dehydrorhamnose 3,5-epimerase